MSSALWSKISFLINHEKNLCKVKILGIDPGSIKCGYGVIEILPKGAVYVTSGTIAPSSTKPLHERLKYIYEGLIAIIRNYRPDHVVVEKMFFAKSVRAAMSLGYARGIALLAAASEEIELHECSALEVKKSVVGYGKAEKEQVQKMVRLILNLQGDLAPDSADAIALALCYANTIKFSNAVKKSNV
jgi:crossover junction endodeoxyribonuclease RuvC